VTDFAAASRPPAAPPVPVRAALVERCATTGITKPECHCPACLAALVATHHGSSKTP
jgi:hypothetical protein